MTKPGHSIIYILLLILITAAAIYLLQHLPSDFIDKNKLAFPDDEQAKIVLDTIIGMQQFVSKLNSGIFVICGVLVAKSRDSHTTWGRIEHYSIIGALVAGAVSYYGFYMSQTAILEMVIEGAINPDSRFLSMAMDIEYYGFLVGASLLGLAFVRMMDAHPKAAPKP